MISLTSSILSLIVDLREWWFLIGKEQNIFYQKSLKIFFIKHSLLCLFLIPLANPNKRINEHKSGFDFLRIADIRIFLSLKVIDPLESVENYESKHSQ